jgi:Arf-GAP/SH3 domain/ANK repeat/PH domain-containing protein
MTLFPFSLPREYRGEYISNKYLQKKYIEHSIEKEALLQELGEAVEANDIKQLLQVYAEGADLSAPLPGYSESITALHLAVELEDLTSLHMVDFLLGNGYVHPHMLYPSQNFQQQCCPVLNEIAM